VCMRYVCVSMCACVCVCVLVHVCMSGFCMCAARYVTGCVCVCVCVCVNSCVSLAVGIHGFAASLFVYKMCVYLFVSSLYVEGVANP